MIRTLAFVNNQQECEKLGKNQPKLLQHFESCDIDIKPIRIAICWHPSVSEDIGFAPWSSFRGRAATATVAVEPNPRATGLSLMQRHWSSLSRAQAWAIVWRNWVALTSEPPSRPLWCGPKECLAVHLASGWLQELPVSVDCVL